MSILDEVLAAMDQADRDRAEEILAAAMAGGGTTLRALAIDTGFGILNVSCEAFGIDPDDAQRVAAQRGREQALATMRAFGVTVPPERLEFICGLVCGGILTGLRLGLMTADRLSKGV